MNLEKVIKNSIANFDGKVAIYYDDLKGNTIKINVNEKYNAASCIKIFILVELFNQINKGIINKKEKLTYKEKDYVNGSGILRYLSKGIKLPISDIATLMMIISDNVATNILIDFLGIENINKTIKSIGCDNTELYSKFKSVENEMFSETTAYDYYLVWKKLNNYELFDKEMTQGIIDIIKNQKYESVRNDGGIVSTIYGNYILTIMIKDFKDENYLNDDYVYDLGRKISNIIFNSYIGKY